MIEGNQIHNIATGGPYQSTTRTYDLIVRNNYFRNVRNGPFWSAGGSSNFDVGRIIADGNIIELLGTNSGTPMGIQLVYPSTGYVFDQVILRNNKVR